MKRERFNRRFSAAFTLVELLVVIAIIALLISMLLPSLTKARESSRRVRCAANMQQIGYAIRLYANVYKGYAPLLCDIPPLPHPSGAQPPETFSNLPLNWDKKTLVDPLMRYGLSLSQLICPSQDIDSLVLGDTGAAFGCYAANYVYLPGLADRLAPDPEINTFSEITWYDTIPSAASIRPFTGKKGSNEKILLGEMNMYWANVGVLVNTLWTNHGGGSRYGALVDVIKYFKGSNRLYADGSVRWTYPKQMGKNDTAPTGLTTSAHYSHFHDDRPYFW